MGVCKGAALAVANHPTVEEFLRRGAAIGCRVDERCSGQILLKDLAMCQDNCASSIVTVIVDRLESDHVEFSDSDSDTDSECNLDPLCSLICDPWFTRRSTMSAYDAYDLYELGRLQCGRYRFRLVCDMQREELCCEYLFLDDDTATPVELRFKLYVDPGNKCLFFEQDQERASPIDTEEQPERQTEETSNSQPATTRTRQRPRWTPRARSRSVTVAPSPPVSLSEGPEPPASSTKWTITEAVLSRVIDNAAAALSGRFAFKSDTHWGRNRASGSRVRFARDEEEADSEPVRSAASLLPFMDVILHNESGSPKNQNIRTASINSGSEVSSLASPTESLKAWKFTCPYYKFNPVVGQRSNDCHSRGWDSMTELW